ncbi:MAG: nidogen-like domain-containing protein [Cyclobacteriaceae bacterium]
MKISATITLFWMLALFANSDAVSQNKNPAVGSAEYAAKKATGKLNQPSQTAKQENYPILKDARSKEQPAGKKKSKKETKRKEASSLASTGLNCSIESPVYNLNYTALPVNDDRSSPAIVLPFTYNFFGNTYDSVYINTNGNITFDAPSPDYTSTGFPSSRDMIAPFWADVDTRSPGSGKIYYKADSGRFTVIWHRVGYYNEKSDKINTFKLVLTDGTDPGVGIGNNVAFYYEDMQWTTGDASGGTNGFYGTPATVGLNNGQGNGACFYYQIGRFGKPGSEYIDAFNTSGVDYLDNRCFAFDASTIETVSVDFTWKNLLCAVDFNMNVDNPQNCQLFYQWDFGDGTTSQEPNPLHSYGSAGTYTVNLSVYNLCGSCQYDFSGVSKQVTIDPDEDLFADTLIYVNTAVKSNVIASSASTFSDAWPLQYEAASMADLPGYLNGSQGVWHSEGVYVYDVERDQSVTPDLINGGTFDMEQFSWEHATLDAVPDWTKVNTMTAYNPYSYEIENKNVLGVYNAAVYDYGGHLPSATGYNMRNDEMAFTSFEYLTGKSSGNWVFGNQPLPLYRWFGTEYNYQHIVVVKASLEDLEEYTEVDVYGYGLFNGGFFFAPLFYRHIRDNPIICRQEYAANPEWSVLILERALFEGYWNGIVLFKNQVQPIISPNIDNTLAHSGTSSLKIASATTFEQPLLRIDSAKSYHLNMWVSVDEVNLTTPELAQGLGINLRLKDENDVVVNSYSFVPSGKIIEGWQQVRGTFTSSVPNPAVEIEFLPGSKGTAWYDDLRLHPTDGNMQSYVYDLSDYRLQAVLDSENFASYYYYDDEGNLYLTKKETEKGIKTLSENVSYIAEQ